MLVRYLLVILLFPSVLFFSCKSKEYNPETVFAKQDIRDTVLLHLMPYLANLPKGASYETRFEERFKPYYRKVLPVYFSWKKLYQAEDGFYYYLIYKKSNSLYDKKIATGGRFKLDSNFSITELEEIFYTPKLKMEELDKKSSELYEIMLKTKGGRGEYELNPEYIEFPDKRCYYDKKLNRWMFYSDSISY